MELHKIKIFPKNEDFLNEMFDFLIEKSPTIKREFFINNILNQETSPLNFQDFLRENSVFELDNVYGSSFQGTHWRDNSQIYAISHTINSIVFEEDIFYGIVELSKNIKYEPNLILRPIYYKPRDSDNFKLGTFDIDYDIIENRA
jgi:hypothetical protein